MSEKGTIKTCIICGKEFEAEHKQTKYCSDECRKKGIANASSRYHKKMKDDESYKHRKVENTLKWQKDNKDKWNDYQKEYTANRYASDPEYKEKKNAIRKKWFENNREKWNSYQREYSRKKREAAKQENKEDKK
jgi:hypothetical protein